jgi:hypothetical protein
MAGGNGPVIAIDKMTDEEFDEIAFDVLGREFGADGLARFLRLHRSGKGDYTAERGRWQQGLSVDDIVKSIRAGAQNQSD